METIDSDAVRRAPWNKGKLVGQKAPLKLKEIWAIRVRLQLAAKHRELAMFNLAVDSKLRACDLVKLRVRDVCHGQTVSARTIVMQQKTQRPVQCEITEPTREAVGAWIAHAGLKSESSLFPSRLHGSMHLSTRQYARIVDSWVRQLGLDKASYGTHTMRRTKATLVARAERRFVAGADGTGRMEVVRDGAALCARTWPRRNSPPWQDALSGRHRGPSRRRRV
jgi:integrase